MTDALYDRFVKKWEETTSIPPQTVGPLTPYYKMITGKLKIMPWRLLIAVAFVFALLLYMFFGSGIATITTLLQRGF